MADSKVPKKLAEKEVDSWLDYKRVKPKKREENKSSVETLVDGFECGVLSLNPQTKEIDFKLDFPIGNEGAIKKLTFKPRLKVGDAHAKLKGVGAGDVDGRIAAYVAALTDKNTALIREIDSEDYSFAQAIAIFFF